MNNQQMMELNTVETGAFEELVIISKYLFLRFK